MAVSPTQRRFCGGRSTPAIRAMFLFSPQTLESSQVLSRIWLETSKLSLALLVLRVGANHAHHPASMNDLALVANLFHARTNFHAARSLQTPIKPLLATGCGARTGPSLIRCYLYRYTILPRVRSYGESSTATLSPAKMRIKFLRILPETCARTWCLFSSSTRNMALGNGSMTVAMTSMASSFGFPESPLSPFFLSSNSLAIFSCSIVPTLTTTARSLLLGASESTARWQ